MGAGLADKSFGARNPILAMVVRGVCGVVIWGWYPFKMDQRGVIYSYSIHLKLEKSSYPRACVHPLEGNRHFLSLSLEGLPSHGHYFLGYQITQESW